MSTIVIYGHSDDLIEVDGAVELEGNGWNAVDEPVTVDGAVVATATWADSGDGTWRLTPNVQMLDELGLEWWHVPAPGEEAPDRVVEVDGHKVTVRGYSDHLIIRGAFRTVEVSGDSGTVKAPPLQVAVPADEPQPALIATCRCGRRIWRLALGSAKWRHDNGGVTCRPTDPAFDHFVKGGDA